MSRCSEGHFSMYQLHNKFSILSGGACLKWWPGSQPCSSMHRGAVIPPHNPMHPQSGISALASDLLVRICGFVSGPACSPPGIKSPSGQTGLHSWRGISLSQFVRMHALSRRAFSSLSLSPTPSTL